MGVDLRERRQLDMAEQVARVRARTRPWRWIFAIVLAIAAAAVSRTFGRHPDHAVLTTAHKAVSYGTAGAFFVLAAAATMGLSGKAKETLQPGIGSTHAALVRIVVVLVGLITTVAVTLSLFGLPVTQLVLGGAVIGVLLGIAAQQTLANLFAGIVLLQSRPFAVGDEVWIRSGALGGQYEGAVTEIGLTYVRVETDDGPTSLPNTQVLAAAIGPRKLRSPTLARRSDPSGLGPDRNGADS